MNYTYKQIWLINFPVMMSILMEQLINITDAVFLGHVGEVELGASAIAGIYYLAVYMLGFGFSIGLQVMIARRNGEQNYQDNRKDFLSRVILFIGISRLALPADSCRFPLSIEAVNFLTGNLSGGNPLFGLAQLRAVVLISFSGYPVFLRWNNVHKSLIVVGCYCGGDQYPAELLPNIHTGIRYFGSSHRFIFSGNGFFDCALYLHRSEDR